MALIEARGISRIYRTGSVDVAALRDVSVAIDAREFVAFVGPSGRRAVGQRQVDPAEHDRLSRPRCA